MSISFFGCIFVSLSLSIVEKSEIQKLKYRPSYIKLTYTFIDNPKNLDACTRI